MSAYILLQRILLTSHRHDPGRPVLRRQPDCERVVASVGERHASTESRTVRGIH